MAASLLSVDTSTKVGAVPLSTAVDAQGNAAARHVIMVEAGGVAAPVGPDQPLPVTGASGPLQDASRDLVAVSIPVLGNGERQLIDIQNAGTCTVGVNFGSPATLGRGSIVLQPGGSLRYAAPGFVPSDIIHAIAAQAAGGAITLKWS